MEPDPTPQIRAQPPTFDLDLREDDADRLRGEVDRRKSGVTWQQEHEHDATSWTTCKVMC